MSEDENWKREDAIVEMLNVPITAQTVETIQCGAVQLLIDLYDKKVTREEFCKDAAPLLELYGQTAKLWLLNNIHQVYKDHGLDEDRFAMAEKGITALIAKGVERATDMAKALRECATDGDKIH